MSFISMMEAKLPPGFRFHPRDDELVCDYLAKKISGEGSSGVVSFLGCPPMIEVDLNKCEPWDLPEMASCVGGKEWYLFSLRDRKYATGQRTNRATASGYWKATGKDRHISRKGVLVGMRKTLVFYHGRAPKGKKTDWVMHEFRMETTGGDDFKYNVKEDWVLCRIFYKSRGLSSKPSMDTNYGKYDEDTCSNSSLPLLPSLEKYISFGQAPMRLEGGYEQVQVPCFSNSASASASAPNNNNNTMMAPAVPTAPPGAMPTRTQLPEFGVLNQQSEHRDKKVVVIRAVLNHLTRFQGSNQNRSWEVPAAATTTSNSTLGQGNYLETSSTSSYLCHDNGLSSVW